MLVLPNPTGRRALIWGLALAGLVLLAAAGLLGFHLVDRFHRHPPPPPRETDVSLIQGWMTIRYIARAYGVPEPELAAALGVKPDETRKQSVNQVADARGLARDEALNRVRAAVTGFRAAHPPPGAPGAVKRPENPPAPPPTAVPAG